MILRLDADDVIVADGKLICAVHDIGRARLADRVGISDLRDRVCDQAEHQKRAFFKENGILERLFIGAEVG